MPIELNSAGKIDNTRELLMNLDGELAGISIPDLAAEPEFEIANAPVICVWDGAAWETLAGAAVPTDAAKVRHYDSSDDAGATPPTAYNVHDKWYGADA